MIAEARALEPRLQDHRVMATSSTSKVCSPSPSGDPDRALALWQEALSLHRRSTTCSATA